MKTKYAIVLLLLLAALLLGGCRYAVVESGSVRIEAPTPTPTPGLADGEA